MNYKLRVYFWIISLCYMFFVAGISYYGEVYIHNPLLLVLVIGPVFWIVILLDLLLSLPSTPGILSVLLSGYHIFYIVILYHAFLNRRLMRTLVLIACFHCCAAGASLLLLLVTFELPRYLLIIIGGGSTLFIAFVFWWLGKRFATGVGSAVKGS